MLVIESETVLILLVEDKEGGLDGSEVSVGLVLEVKLELTLGVVVETVVGLGVVSGEVVDIVVMGLVVVSGLVESGLVVSGG